jgi:predicted GIY-YIG superfamily endonuclease
MKDKKYKIYAIVDITEGVPVYIGSTTQPLQHRLTEHATVKTCTMYTYINSRGKDNFEIIQLDSASDKDEALAKESMLTRHFQSFCSLKNVDIGKHRSALSRAKISNTKTGVSNEKLKRPVRNIDTEEIFEGVIDASTKYNIPIGNITFCCQHKRKTAGGYHWAYVD